MAEKLKESGNAAFTAGRYEEAAKLYAQASTKAPGEPVYLSNLSAAQFELGDYGACATTILKTAPLLNNSTDALQRKLAHRLARSLCHGRMSSGLQSADHEAVDRFEAISRADAANADAGAVWDAWHTLAGADVNLLRAEGQQALIKQRLFKNMQASFGFEYYTVGQDDVESLLMSTTPPLPDIQLSKLDVGPLSELNFLVGGCGDSRHAFGTLIDIHQQMLGNAMRQSQKDAVSVHITLVDIHPTTVARVLLYLNVLSQLADALDTADEEEAVAAFLYIYMAPVIPGYVHTRITQAMQTIITQLETDSFPSWLVGPTDPAPVIASLRHWLGLKIDTRDYVSSVPVHIHRDIDEMLSGTMAGLQLSPEYLAMLRGNKGAQERSILQANLSLPEGHLRGLVPGGAKMSRAQLNKHVEQAVKKNIEYFTNRVARAGLRDEQKVYPKLKTIIPSHSLREKYHKPMHQLAQDVRAMMINPYELRDPPTGLPTQAALNAALAHMYKEWRANPLSFVRPDRNMPRQNASGYPDSTWDVHGLITGFDDILKKRIPGYLDDEKELAKHLDAQTFARGALFFRRTARAFKALRGRLKFEVVASDVYAWLEKCRLGLARPAGSMCPSKYTRMWLSNVPDYGGGPLNVAVYCAPCFQSLTASGATFNILLNTGTWKNMEHYNYHYSLMNIRDMPRVVGCVLNSRTANDNLSISLPNESQRKDIAPRPELTRWLVRLFLNLIFHGKSGLHQTGARVDTPNTLAFFLRVLIHLHSFVGVPGHFLAETLQGFLADKVASDARPYTGYLPIVPQPAGPVRKLHLAPWLAELRALVAQVRGALPFYVSLELRQEDLATCEAPFSMQDDFMQGSSMRQPALALLLYSRRIDPRRLHEVYERMLDGERVADAHVFTGFEIDRPKKTVRWVMEAQKLRAAHSAGWGLTIFRLESMRIASSLVPSTSWILPPDLFAEDLEAEPLD
ncbi:hypothetical protein AURDEDRAFT_137443 [Auricularia subglabra TFB-10046 SS5]|uniref:DUF4470 domain-containing protein n=1 Tax=Auricularia subglabra (strain TFB-10046 / SS5) TaxID=717982 RepID=J0WXY1_AURST|nr:hypothetical protein AURDEDRAFT_137443 [Auricularia subglabra TFB-10046 SS5]